MYTYRYPHLYIYMRIRSLRLQAKLGEKSCIGDTSLMHACILCMACIICMHADVVWG